MSEAKKIAKRDLYQEVTDKLIAAIEAGTAPWQRPWEHVASAGLPMNGSSERHYNGVNALLLMMTAQAEGYADNRWFTFKQASDMGAKVKKGSKSTPVYFFKMLDAKGAEVDEAAARDGKQSRQIPFLTEYRVFHASQIEGIEPLPQPERQWTPLETVRQLVERMQPDIRYGGDRAFYAAGQGRDFIQMPPEGAFPSAEAFAGTLAHELGHWTGAEHRLNRKFGAWGSDAYAAEELRAEICSACLCAELGMVSKDEIGATLAIHLAVGIVVAMLINQYAQVVGFFVWIEESALTAVGNSPWSALAGLFSGVLKSIVAGFKMVGDTYSCLGIMSSGLFAALADALLAMIIYFAALVLLLYAIVELLTVVVVAPVIAGIGVAFGPLLIAALANEWSRSWFVTWVKFLLSALMIWVVLTATLQLLTTSFLSVSQQWFGDAKGTLSGQALGMAILMVCVGKIFSAVPAITDGLMGAKTGASAANVGGRGFAAAATAALATTAAALGATRSGVSAAGGATMAGATAGAAAQQGAKAAWESFTKSMGAMRGK